MSQKRTPIIRLLAERMTVPDDLAAGERLYRMFVRDLVLPCSIGVYPHEHQAPQKVRINVSMRVHEPNGPVGDDIRNVLSYEDVIGGIKGLIARGHINLVETFAEAIAELCLVDERVAEVRVMVEKLEVEPNASGVGIEIVRRREQHRRGAEIYPLPFSP